MDDDEGIRLLIPRMLSNLGVTTFTAATLAQAMEIMASEPADFIFLDLRLPDSPSAEKTLHAIQDLKMFNASAPVVVFTGDPNDKLEVVSKALGASGFLRKDDLASQRDLYHSMKDAMEELAKGGITKTDAMTMIQEAVNVRLEKMERT